MKFYYITFRSVTFAQQGEGLLQKKGIRCTLLRTPKWMEQQGCGYSLRLRCRDVTAAVELLRQHQVAFRKVYTQRERGRMEEMYL